ncbi:MAG TPA: hypothetical protein VF429_05255, partial [Anaerolineae bacterium]
APKISHPLDQNFGAVKLLGYDVDPARLNALPNRWHAENGHLLRVTLYWQPQEKITADAMVSIKILGADQRVAGQIDQRPVLDAYPTPAWRAGEVIVDTYAVPLFLGVTPSEYSVSITLYDATTGSVIGQQELEKITPAADVTAPRYTARSATRPAAEYFAQSLAGYGFDAWNIARRVDADFGALSLVGYSLGPGDHVTVRPGDALPLTLLWRAGSTKLPDGLLVRMWLEDSEGKIAASRDAPISIGYPPSVWQSAMYVRDVPLLRVPANVADGEYALKLAVVRNNAPLGSALLPFIETTARLGHITIKNRPRAMTAPLVAHPLEVTFDKKIKLLGYDLTRDIPQRGVRVTLYWKSLALMDAPYTVFIHLLDEKHNVLASADAAPANGDLPTTGWIEEEYLTDIHSFTLPPDLPDGGYPIEIGWYDPATGVRLQTADGQDHMVLTSINTP